MNPVDEKVAQLLRDLADPEPYELGQGGHCLTHGWKEEARGCPHPRAVQILEGYELTGRFQ